MNTKKIISAAVSLVIGLGVMPLAVNAAEVQEYTECENDTYTYNKYSDHITITRYKGNAEKVEIPEKIEGLPVTMLEPFVFGLCPDLAEITLPATLESIGSAEIQSPLYMKKKLLSVTIKNPECNICDGSYTICNGWELKDGFLEGYFYGTIYGYEGSTAQAYAEKCQYKFSALKDFTLGDINSDKEINALDASLVLTEYAAAATGGNSVFTGDQKKSADVNKDGAIDALDASLILSYYAFTATGGTGSLGEFLKK